MYESGLNVYSPLPRGSGHNQNIITPDSIGEILISGSRNNGRMSSVRRFFCLFVTFDLFLTILLWMLCIVVRNNQLIN